MVFDGTLSACVPKAACNRAITSVHVPSGSVGNDNKLNEESENHISGCTININISFQKIAILPVSSFLLLHLPFAFLTVFNLSKSNFFLVATKYSQPRCSELADGDYSAGCVSEFTTCIGGFEFRKNCPDSMVFSNVLRRCVSYDHCAFLMFRVLASFHPSQIADSYEGYLACFYIVSVDLCKKSN